MKTWDKITREHIEMPEKMVLFLDEIDNICKKYNLSISHEDVHGSFEIEKYNEMNIQWLRYANKDYK